MVLGQEDMGEGSRETASPGKGQFCLMEGGPHGLDSGRWRSSRGGVSWALWRLGRVGDPTRPRALTCPQRWCRDAGVSSRPCVAVCAQGHLREKQHFPSGFRGLCLEPMAQPTGFSARWVRHLNTSAARSPEVMPRVLLHLLQFPRPRCPVVYMWATSSFLQHAQMSCDRHARMALAPPSRTDVPIGSKALGVTPASSS